MSSLETLTLLELARGRPKSMSAVERRPSPIVSHLSAAACGLSAFGHRSLLLIVLLSVWEGRAQTTVPA